MSGIKPTRVLSTCALSILAIHMIAAAPAMAQALQQTPTGEVPNSPGTESPPLGRVTSSDDVNSQIIVTARRRAENIQRVPVSIVAFNQTTLTQNAVASASDLGRVTPGLVAVAGSGLPTQVDFSIRGRGLNFGAAAGSVETYFAEAVRAGSSTIWSAGTAAKTSNIPTKCRSRAMRLTTVSTSPSAA